MPIEDLLRLLNMALILIWFYYMWNLYTWWASRPREERMLLTSIPLLLVLVMFASGESLAQDIGFGSRVLLFTPVLILCIISTIKLVRKIRSINQNREEDT